MGGVVVVVVVFFKISGTNRRRTRGRLIAGQRAKPGELLAGPVFGNFIF
jgi:hypothetical protein